MIRLLKLDGWINGEVNGIGLRLSCFFSLPLSFSLFSLGIWRKADARQSRQAVLITDPNTVDKFKEQFVDVNSSWAGGKKGRRTGD